jgi:hypothetical protein
MDDLPVCERHMMADVMPHSGRCRACIEESNADARPYLETAHILATGCRKMLKYLNKVQKDCDEDPAID